MGTYTLTCRTIRKNNGIRQAWLTSDKHVADQPIECLWNGTAIEFVEGAQYHFQITRVARKLDPMES